jgi:hypothetical protein
MRSSTFSSNHPAIFYAKLLVGICAILIVAFELLTRKLTLAFPGNTPKPSRFARKTR